MTPFALIITGAFFFIAAAAFLAAELFFPSHGLLGIFSAVFAVAGVIAMYLASALLGVISALILVIVAPVTFYFAIKFYPQSPVGKRVMLRTPDSQSLQGFSLEAKDLQNLTGKRGIAATMLRPAGIVEVDGKRVDCLSEGEIIEAGTPVEIVRVSGMKVIVKGVG